MTVHACHNGNYNNTPNTCAGCHMDDYNATTDPNHKTLQFPKECESCHSESAWLPSTFNHDGLYFPIYQGKHKGEWDQCMDCHNSPGNFKQFTCINCHQNPRQIKNIAVFQDIFILILLVLHVTLPEMLTLFSIIIQQVFHLTSGPQRC